ncbi:DUF5074 domain-containing protein [Niabella hibiscisoli]|uniref:DUF5074 domain-containing protein n=1 Tax=Niabella hibiscisoli TaxID=1825928 RepID=UPI001F0D2740|nr:DUF5074 domain-containing protein [Niabella hibiscisoli]MCH5716065.1 hypothetical protein [Niabella hibiscisoli]
MTLLKNNLFRLSVIALIAVLSTACSKNEDLPIGGPDPVETASYSNGFFIVTEGSYGQTAGTVQYYAYGADTIATKVYEKENPGKVTSNVAKTSTLQFASLYNKKLYLVSKINGPVLKLDAATLKEEARYNQETSNWRSLIGVKDNSGLISANDGVYSVDLNSLNIQYKLSSVSAVNTAIC